MDDIHAGEIVIPCSPFDETVSFFVNELKFQIKTISPADDPSVIVVFGYGLTLRLERSNDNNNNNQSNRLRLFVNENPREIIAPNGTRIELVQFSEEPCLPSIKQSLVITKLNDDAQWIKGRAGMFYRDLIPGRQGGRFIGSHIKIIDGGPVNDHVHYHNIRFQMIYVYQGWVRLVYEDQGDEFVLHAGDCVLQPPLIRHRVLESSAQLQVIEIACPAVHDTFIDHQLTLPNRNLNFDRNFHGQYFLKYLANQSKTSSKPWRLPAFTYRDIGIGKATNGLAGARIIQNADGKQSVACKHQAEFVFLFVLCGQISLNLDEQETIEILDQGDSFVLPENLFYSLENPSNDLQILEVSLPDTFEFILRNNK